MNERICPHCDEGIALLSVGEDDDGEEYSYCPECGERVDWEDMEEVENDA